MGLLDSFLNRGAGPAMGGGSATSPMVKALMLLLAAKAFQSYRSGGSTPDATRQGGGLGGMLGGLFGGGQQAGGGLFGGSSGGGLGGGLGGLLGGLAGGGSGGLGGLFDQFRRNGYGDHVDSWVGTGQNRRMAPEELARVLGPEAIEELERRTGMPRKQLLAELADELPDAVDQVTPDGRFPTEQELASRFH
ncbi:YidB family protein [Prosthecomicrobium sp. N25]|uniref:YidB family protein n=1 Tax=Prosthecomicrobium sp. N25 TaxID=3129254 RepID=UPI00307725B0